MKIRIIQPDYYKTFKCIGAVCRNNCCTGNWEIHIDKNTYKKYRNLSKDHLFYNELKSHIKIHNRDSSLKYAEYLRVDTNETGKSGCVFQTKEGWCKIHAELGEEYLGYTCKIYPRIINEVEFKNSDMNFFERSCNISCEEIGNIFINKEDYIEYEIIEEEHSKNYILDNFHSKINNRVNENVREIVKYYNDIRSIAIAILQNREYQFEDRLILLAIFCEKLDRLEAEKDIEQIPAYIEDFVTLVDSSSYYDILNINIENSISYTLVFGILDAFLEKHSVEKDEGVFGKLYYIIQESKLDNIDYKECMVRFKTLLNDREVFIEHIFVNELFTKMMPFYSKYSIFENAQILAMLYSIYRVLIATELREKTELSDEELVDITAYFGKGILHSNLIDTLLIDTIKKLNMDSLSNIILLIKGR